MSRSTETFAFARGRAHPAGACWTAVCHALGWPGRVYRARQLMHRLGTLADHELRDIGLTRLDLRDAGALPSDADPSLVLRARAAERRRRG